MQQKWNGRLLRRCTLASPISKTCIGLISEIAKFVINGNTTMKTFEMKRASKKERDKEIYIKIKKKTFQEKRHWTKTKIFSLLIRFFAGISFMGYVRISFLY